MPRTMTRDDRRALRGYLARFSWATQDYLGSPLRRIRAELRSETISAAGELGMDRALADLGDPGALAERYAQEHGRRGPRGARLAVRLTAAAVVIAAMTSGVLLVRGLPRVELTGETATDPAFVLTPDAVMVTYVATNIGDGSATVGMVVRNPGPFTETITGVDTLTSRVGLVPGLPHGGIDDAMVHGTMSPTLTLPAGGTAMVRVEVFFPPCASFSAGSGTGVDEAELRVRMLGITRTVTLPLGASYELISSDGRLAPATCEPGGTD